VTVAEGGVLGRLDVGQSAGVGVHPVHPPVGADQGDAAGGARPDAVVDILDQEPDALAWEAAAGRDGEIARAVEGMNPDAGVRPRPHPVLLVHPDAPHAVVRQPLAGCPRLEVVAVEPDDAAAVRGHPDGPGAVFGQAHDMQAGDLGAGRPGGPGVVAEPAHPTLGGHPDRTVPGPQDREHRVMEDSLARPPNPDPPTIPVHPCHAVARAHPQVVAVRREADHPIAREPVRSRQARPPTAVAP